MPTVEQWHALADALDEYDNVKLAETPGNIAARALVVVRYARALVVAHATETPPERANRVVRNLIPILIEAEDASPLRKTERDDA